MALALRCSRKGNTHRPFYKVLAIDSRKKRSGTFKEELGNYDPTTKIINLNVEATKRWMDLGAIPSDLVKSLYARKCRELAEVAPGGVAQL
jgi:small subunit ribosomal protein S16